MGAGTRLGSAAVAVVPETRPSGGARGAGGVGRGAWGVAGLGAGTGPGKEAWGALPEPGGVSRPGALEGPVGAAPSRAPFAHPFPDALQDL